MNSEQEVSTPLILLQVYLFKNNNKIYKISTHVLK